MPPGATCFCTDQTSQWVHRNLDCRSWPPEPPGKFFFSASGTLNFWGTWTPPPPDQPIPWPHAKAPPPPPRRLCKGGGLSRGGTGHQKQNMTKGPKPCNSCRVCMANVQLSADGPGKSGGFHTTSRTMWDQAWGGGGGILSFQTRTHPKRILAQNVAQKISNSNEWPPTRPTQTPPPKNLIPYKRGPRGTELKMTFNGH